MCHAVTCKTCGKADLGRLRPPRRPSPGRCSAIGRCPGHAKGESPSLLGRLFGGRS